MAGLGAEATDTVLFGKKRAYHRGNDFMEPAPIGALQWSELGSMLFALWMSVIFIVLFAANMLMGHNLLPTFIATRHVPESLEKARLLFYAFAIVCFAIAMYFLYSTIEQGDVLRDIWDSYWI